MSKKEEIIISTQYKPNELTYFKAGRYIGENFPDAGACQIYPETDKDGYHLRIIMELKGEVENA